MHRFPLVPERLSLTAQGRTDSCEGPCPGRHMGRPLQIQLKPPSTPGGAGGDRAPPLPVYRGVQQRADVPKAWPPPTKFRSEIWGVGHRHRPLRGEGKAPSATLASGAEHLRQRSQGVGGTCGRDHPQSVQQPRAIPQSRHSRDSSLCTREPLACGGRESGRTHRSAPTRSSECPATPGGAGQSPPPTERRGIRRGLGR